MNPLQRFHSLDLPRHGRVKFRGLTKREREQIERGCRRRCSDPLAGDP